MRAAALGGAPALSSKTKGKGQILCKGKGKGKGKGSAEGFRRADGPQVLLGDLKKIIMDDTKCDAAFDKNSSQQHGEVRDWIWAEEFWQEKRGEQTADEERDGA